MKDQPAPTDLESAQNRAIAYHKEKAPDAIRLWSEGIDLILAGIELLDGFKTAHGSETLSLAIIARASQTLTAALHLAVRGYYPQALNLLRTPIEDWMAYWNFRNFPGDFDRFLDKSKRAPTFNEMLQAIEGKHALAPDPKIRDWIRRFHEFSHIDRKGVMMAYEKDAQGDVRIITGPEQNESIFNYCAAEAIAEIHAFLEVIDNLLLLLGFSAIEGRTDYQMRAQRWCGSLLNV